MTEKSEKVLIKVKLTPEELKIIESEREEAKKNGERFSMRAVLEQRFEKGLKEIEKQIKLLKKEKLISGGIMQKKSSDKAGSSINKNKNKNGASKRRTGKK